MVMSKDVDMLVSSRSATKCVERRNWSGASGLVKSRVWSANFLFMEDHVKRDSHNRHALSE